MSAVKEKLRKAIPSKVIGKIRVSRRFLRMPPAYQWKYVYNKRFKLKNILSYPPIHLPPAGSDTELHLLTCHSHTYMSLYALYSWYHFSERPNPLVLHDDGTLLAEDHAIYERIFPGVTIIARSDADRIVEKQLADYPALRSWRSGYPLAMRELDFPILATSSCFIIYDSDLCFFKKPTVFLQHLEECERGARHNVFGQDSQNSYAFARWQIKSEFGLDLPDRLNGGFGIAHKDSLDVPLLTKLLGMEDILGYFCWIGQTMWAVMSAQFGVVMLPDHLYQVATKPGIGTADMRHYVGPQRHLFYAEAVSHMNNTLRSVG